MTSAKTMEALIRLAARKVDDAAQALAKLKLLTDYREDYFVRFGAQAAAGLAEAQLANYRAFLARLETAIAEQQRLVEDARAGVVAAQAQWQAGQQRLKSYEVLDERRLTRQRALGARREQREQDEYAAHLHRRTRTA
jgi:flagellar protein FliJ